MDELVAAVGNFPLVTRATQIALPHVWASLQRDGPLVWGRYKGSAEYAVAVDLMTPRYRCTCPTSTQPCKHSLALHMIALQHPGRVADAQPPETLAAWLAQPDPPSPAKKRASAPSEASRTEREAVITAGVEELELWLADLVRTGVASLPTRPYAAVEEPVRRLHDAKAAGLARTVADLGASAAAGPGWQERVVGRIGRLHLLLEAWRRRDALDPDLRADVSSLIGIPVRQQQVLELPPVDDVWDAVGEQITSVDDDNRKTMRTWLRGRSTARVALLLQFEFPGQSLDRGAFKVGHAYEAGICFYPSAWPLRGLVKTRGLRLPVTDFPGTDRLADMHTQFVDALCRHPWLEALPVSLRELHIYTDGPNFTAFDNDGCQVDLELSTAAGLQLLAISGGAPVGLFGEWNGVRFHPLSVWGHGEILNLGDDEP